MDETMEDPQGSRSGPSRGSAYRYIGHDSRAGYEPAHASSSHRQTPETGAHPPHTHPPAVRQQSPAAHALNTSWADEQDPGSYEDEEDDAEPEDDEEEGEEEEEADALSETSSAMFDPSADPEGFARRLDELAGTLEMSVEEARALQQGPILGKGKKKFKAYLNHYLSSTEWKYAAPSHAGSLLCRQGGEEIYQPGDDLSQLHPIRVLGRSWVGREVGGNGTDLMEVLGISEGLPSLAESSRVQIEGLMR